MTSAADILQPVRMLAQAGRLEEAFGKLRQLAEDGVAEALALLGDYCWEGRLVERDPARARDFYRRAGDAGDRRSSIIYTNLLASGIAGPRDWTAALTRLEEEGRSDLSRARTRDMLDVMQIDGQGDPLHLPERESLSDDPPIHFRRSIFSGDECGYLLDVAAPAYQPSTVHHQRLGAIANPLRTSEGSAIHWLIEDPAVHALNRRLAAASGTEVNAGEPLLVLRYRTTEQYRRHLDALPGLDNQRAMTILVWLNSGYAGGETEFCRLGLTVKGEVGDALVFRNVTNEDRPDDRTEHAGLPVTRDVKYLASRWVRSCRHAP